MYAHSQQFFFLRFFHAGLYELHSVGQKSKTLLFRYIYILYQREFVSIFFGARMVNADHTKTRDVWEYCSFYTNTDHRYQARF